jgi:hypothetical protein
VKINAKLSIMDFILSPSSVIRSAIDSEHGPLAELWSILSEMLSEVTGTSSKPSNDRGCQKTATCRSSLAVHIGNATVHVDPTMIPASLYLLAKELCIYSHEEVPLANMDKTTQQSSGQNFWSSGLVALDEATVCVRNLIRGQEHVLRLQDCRYQFTDHVGDGSVLHHDHHHPSLSRDAVEHLFGLAQVTLTCASLDTADNSASTLAKPAGRHSAAADTGNEYSSGTLLGRAVLVQGAILSSTEAESVVFSRVRSKNEIIVRLRELYVRETSDAAGTDAQESAPSAVDGEVPKRNANASWTRVDELFVYKKLLPLLTS